jgi:nucleoside-diphosphate-sugar epimerase
MSLNVLVTGATGFIGSALCAYLTKDPALTVYGTFRNARTRPMSGGCNYVQCDLAEDTSTLPRGIDIVVHAAACLDFSDADISRLEHDNVIASRNLASYCLSTGVRRCIHLSTTSVYGDCMVAELNEASPTNPVTDYGWTKLAAEEAIKAAAPELQSISLRLPAVVGPGATRIFPALLFERLGHECALFYNPDNYYNHIIHINDLVVFIRKLLESSWYGAPAFPIAASQPITMRELVTLAARLIGSNSVLCFEEDRNRPGFILSVLHAAQVYGFSSLSVIETLEKYAKSRNSRLQDDFI